MADDKGTRAEWQWLSDTFWYVKPGDLPALQLDPDEGALSWLVDQTVWHISGYRNGYFWGVTAVLLYDAGEGAPAGGPRSRISHLTLLGTVMPDGGVQITFVPSGRLSGSPTVGFGRMVEVGREWGFEMQMSTDRVGKRVLHWATMARTREGDPSWSQLPGLDYSVPKMLEGAVYPRFGEAGG